MKKGDIEILSEHIVDGKRVRVMKSETDPLAIRISAGGRDEVGYYIHFRGNLENVEDTLKLITKAFGEFKNRNNEIKKSKNPNKSEWIGDTKQGAHRVNFTKVTSNNIKYGMLIRYHDPWGGCHAGVKVHFFNKKGVLIGNIYKFVPYDLLEFRLPSSKGKNRDYQRFFMDKPFEKTRRFVLILFLNLVTKLMRWTQKYMD